MSKLFSVFHILDVTAANCINAISSAISDYEDAVLEQAARDAHIDCIVTRNARDFRSGIVKAILPEDLLSSDMFQD